MGLIINRKVLVLENVSENNAGGEDKRFSLLKHEVEHGYVLIWEGGT